MGNLFDIAQMGLGVLFILIQTLPTCFATPVCILRISTFSHPKPGHLRTSRSSSAKQWKFPNLQSRPNDIPENSIVFGAKPETTTVPPPEETAKPSQRHSDNSPKEPNLGGFYFLVKPYLLLGDVREIAGADFQFLTLNVIVKSFEIRILTDFRSPQNFSRTSPWRR